MGWWITGIVRRFGTEGAVANVRMELEAQRLRLGQVDAAVRRLSA